MSKVQLTGAFARFRGKLNKSEVLVLKGCPCGKEQMAMDLLNPSKAKHVRRVQLSVPLTPPRTPSAPSSPSPSSKSTSNRALINEYLIMKRGILIGLIVLGAMMAMTSCNVTRTVTTQSQYWQKGDTSVVIQTRTIESYDATKKAF